jgi:TM2 domain-containing membrane protein YozV
MAAIDRYRSNSDATGVTILVYVAWFFLGMFGVHRFVTGNVGSGFLMLVLHGLGWLTFWIGGFLLIGVVFIWWLVDALLIPGMVRR